MKEQTQLAAMGLVLMAVQNYTATLLPEELEHFNSMMDAPLRTAHSMMSYDIRTRDENGDACSAQDAMKLALGYYNAKVGELTIATRYQSPQRARLSFWQKLKRIYRS